MTMPTYDGLPRQDYPDNYQTRRDIERVREQVPRKINGYAVSTAIGSVLVGLMLFTEQVTTDREQPSVLLGFLIFACIVIFVVSIVYISRNKRTQALVMGTIGTVSTVSALHDRHYGRAAVVGTLTAASVGGLLLQAEDQRQASSPVIPPDAPVRRVRPKITRTYSID